MAVESGAATRTSGFTRRLTERVNVWRRLFLTNWNLFKASRIGVVGLAIMLAFVIIALAAPFMGLRDPIRWTAPDEDLIDVATFWTKDSSLAGSEFRGIPPVSQGPVLRVESRSSDARADRLYVAATNRLYALATTPSALGQNVWGTANLFVTYFDVTAGNASRTITTTPLLMNYGDFSQGPADYEIYLGTSDGTLYLLRDTGGDVPTGANTVAQIRLDNSSVTGLAAYTGDDTAAYAGPSIPASSLVGNANFISSNDNTSWTVQALPGSSTGDQGEFGSLALDGAGTPYYAFYDWRNGHPWVAVRNGTSWDPRTWEPYSTTVNNGLYTSVAIGTDARPQVAYYDETSQALKYAVWNATASTFDASFVDSYYGVGQYASLALNRSSNLPSIAYYNASASGSLEYASFNGTGWTLETVDSGFVGQYASLAIDPVSGRAHVAYYDAANRALKYAEKTGPTWTTTTVDSGGVGEYASLALDPVSRLPSIAYSNASGGSLKYAAWNGTTSRFDISVVDSSPDVGRYASLAFRGAGEAAIAYHDARNLDLKYATRNATSGAWLAKTIFSSGQTGLYASLAFDRLGHPRIAFYSYTTGRTSRDMLVAGTANGGLYGIDVSIPKVIDQSQARVQQVVRWDYRIRWHQELGSAAHLASGPGRYISAVPTFSPAFNADGSAVFVGTQVGNLTANRTADGTGLWGPVRVGGPWSTAPIVQLAGEDVPSVKNREIVYAAGGLQPNGLSRLFTRYATNGTILPQWQSFADGAAPVGPSAAKPDGGNLTQPAVEGGVVYVGSDSGWMYALRRDASPPSIPDPASVKWSFLDPTLLGLHPKFQSGPLIRVNEGLLLVSAKEDNGTAADASDDHSVLYSMSLNGTISWRKAFPSVIAGTPASYNVPAGLGLAVFVGYGGPGQVTGVQSLAASGRFLAPSEPTWAHSYNCPPPVGRRCPGYPSGNQYWLGLDSQGRDIFSQVIWGSRIALLVGFLAAFFSVVIGVIVGLIAGYVGGKTESVLMRFTDVILVLPGLPLIIAMAAVLGSSIWNIILVISLLGWPGITRIIRAEVLSLKERPFIDSARVTGASTTRIVFRHIAPNVMPLAFLYMTFAVSGAILTEAALSFIGLGDVTTMSWGIMLQLVSQSKALEAWWWLLPPGLAITLISLAFFLVGRAFDEIVNPRLRKR